MSLESEIIERIKSNDKDWIFTSNDFVDLDSQYNIHLILFDMASNKVIKELSDDRYILNNEIDELSEPLKLVVVGDSLITGFSIGEENSFVSKLDVKLKQANYNVDAIRSGAGGRTTRIGLNKIGNAIAIKPDAAIIVLGGNDMLQRIDPDITRNNLDNIIDTLKSNNIKVMLTGMMAYRKYDADYIDRFDSIYPDLAAKHDIALYPFFLDGIALDPAYNLPDKKHPNTRGIDEIVQRIFPYVEKFISDLL